MRLPQEFYKLPLQFDAARLRQEISQLPAAAWNAHPDDYVGNSSVRLISAGGLEDDSVGGPMRPTRWLAGLPYLQQVLASFGVVWSRSRLMRLAPQASVPEHADINYHWFTRVRLHIPIVTRAEVQFYCGSKSVHMAAGEAWIFDNWRRHRVENPTGDERVHLVADTSGSSAFWQMVASGADAPISHISFEAAKSIRLLTECGAAPPLMPPSEVELLASDLRAEASLDGDDPAARLALARFKILLDSFCRDWRQLWALYGDAAEARPQFMRLRDDVRAAAATLGASIRAQTNDVPVVKILEGRILRHLISPGASPPPPGANPETAAIAGEAPARPARPTVRAPRFARPLIVVAAPRSGSTLLFETLACSPQLWNLGGEAHWLVETTDELRPGAADIDSNRLLAQHCTDAIRDVILAKAAERLRDAAGTPWQTQREVRLLEKTPKNALRIPFFERVFPDAQFLFLWRDPRENVGSIMEGWRAGRWVTYPQLPGWEGPWSFLLPPGWQGLRGRPLEEIAAYQWETTNRIVLDDLAQLPRERWLALDYAALTQQPRHAIERICRFTGLEFDRAFQERSSGVLPHSRYTLTPPASGKWRQHHAEIERVLPSMQTTWDRLRLLQAPKT